MKTRFNSLGSVIGTLDSVSVHRRKRADLWTTRGGRRVEVRFEAEQLNDVVSLLGQHVTSANCVATRIAAGHNTVRGARWWVWSWWSAT